MLSTVNHCQPREKERAWQLQVYQRSEFALVCACAFRKRAHISTCASWPKLWDMALDHGVHGTDALQALFRTLTRPMFGQRICPVCETQQVEPSHFEHYITHHTPITNSEFIIDLLANESVDVFIDKYAQHFLRPS